MRRVSYITVFSYSPMLFHRCLPMLPLYITLECSICKHSNTICYCHIYIHQRLDSPNTTKPNLTIQMFDMGKQIRVTLNKTSHNFKSQITAHEIKILFISYSVADRNRSSKQQNLIIMNWYFIVFLVRGIWHTSINFVCNFPVDFHTDTVKSG